MSANQYVVLSEAAYRRIQEYAQVAGVSVERAANDAIVEWMNSTGDLFIEAVRKRRRPTFKAGLTLVRNPATSSPK